MPNATFITLCRSTCFALLCLLTTLPMSGCMAMRFVPTKAGPAELDPNSQPDQLVTIHRFPTTDNLTLEGRLYQPTPIRTSSGPLSVMTVELPPELTPDNSKHSGMLRLNLQKVAGHSRPADGAAVLFLHGVADNNASIMPQMFRLAGFTVFQFDYRNFGNSDKATMTNQGFMDDATSALNYLRSVPNINPSKIIIAGHSMGGIYAMHLAASQESLNTPTSALITMASPSSWRRLGGRFIPVLGFLLGGVDGPPPTAFARNIKSTPWIIMHPQDDRAVPLSHAHDLAATNWKAGGRAQLVILPTGDHVSAFIDYPSFEVGTIAWIEHQLKNTINPTPNPHWLTDFPDPMPLITISGRGMNTNIPSKPNAWSDDLFKTFPTLMRDTSQSTPKPAAEPVSPSGSSPNP